MAPRMLLSTKMEERRADRAEERNVPPPSMSQFQKLRMVLIDDNIDRIHGAIRVDMCCHHNPCIYYTTLHSHISETLVPHRQLRGTRFQCDVSLDVYSGQMSHLQAHSLIVELYHSRRFLRQ